ncbi:MAG: peptidyl-prolyl cis-trans isomerase [Candidatus Cloacimonetes bacterium]|nr:peptidyl-prolyl cis-trans isomerase [Candidatus Cloacimonadota bacterium]
MKIRLLIVVTALLISGFLWAEIAPETVLAKYSNGEITMENFNQRLNMIPVMYQGRYQSYEGKVKFLNELATEEMFYQEALALGLDTDPEIEEKAINQIKATYYTEYQKYLKNNEIKISDEELYEYFLEHLDDFPGVTFDESKVMVEKQYRPQVEKEFFENYDQELWQKYNVTIHEELLDSLDFNDQSTFDPIAEQKYVTSNNPEVEQTIADLKKLYDGLPNRNKQPFLRLESRLNSIREMTKMDLYYHEALKAGFDQNAEVLKAMPMVYRNLMLREVYNRLVTNKIEVNENTVHEYYNNNLEKFSTKPFRKIQAFGFKSEKEAKKARKTVKKALKKDDTESLSAVLASSVFEFENGEIDHIYKNNIIPKCGTDTLWCDVVWNVDYGKTEPNELSEVFKSAQDFYVFFRVLEDTVPVATPFDEAKVQIENEMRRDRSRELFETADLDLRQKYGLELFEDNLVEKLTAEEYFTNAENAQKKRRYTDAIYYYDQICEYYPNGSDDYKAMFMKGFLYSEEIKDKEKAIGVFENLIDQYPDGDLSDDARYMIDELNGKTNVFENMK